MYVCIYIYIYRYMFIIIPMARQRILFGRSVQQVNKMNNKAPHTTQQYIYIYIYI